MIKTTDGQKVTNANSSHPIEFGSGAGEKNAPRDRLCHDSATGCASADAFAEIDDRFPIHPRINIASSSSGTRW
jgi:hypothetical protein